MKLVEKKKSKIDAFEMVDLQELFNVPPMLLEILVDKGFNDQAKIKDFLKPGLSSFYPFEGLSGIKESTDLIKKAISSEINIVIFSYPDVEGIISTAVLMLEIRRLGGLIDYSFINRNDKDLNIASQINEANKSNNNKLAIFINTEKHNTNKIDIKTINISTQKIKELGKEGAININPNQNELIIDGSPIQDYQFIDLSLPLLIGKVIHSLSGVKEMFSYADLLALGTLSGKSPLVKENRAIVVAGNNYIRDRIKNNKMNPGLANLINQETDEDHPFNNNTLKFKISSIIKTVAEFGNPRAAVELLVGTDQARVNAICNQAVILNEKRIEIENDIIKDIEKLELDSDKVNFIKKKPHWKKGVLIEVAKKVSRNTNRPTLIIAPTSINNVYEGILTGIYGADAYKSLRSVSSLLEEWSFNNGIGLFKIIARSVPSLQAELLKHYNQLDSKIFEKKVYYDYKLNIKDVNDELLKTMELLEPTGIGNPKPVFVMENVDLVNTRVHNGEEKHFFGTVVDEFNDKIALVAFNTEPINEKNVDIVFEPGVNNYNNKPQITAKEFIVKVKSDLLEGVQYGIAFNPRPIEVLELPKAKNNQFSKKGITNLHELLLYIPKDYNDYRNPINYNEAEDGVEQAIIGTITSASPGKGKMVSAMVKDENGQEFKCVWFNQNHVYNRLKKGQTYIFLGKFTIGYSGLLEMQPKVFDQNIEKYKKLTPNYKKIKGMADTYLMSSIDSAFEKLENTDYLTYDIVKDYSLLPSLKAYQALHQPNSPEELEQAIYRHTFDALFKFSYNLKSIHGGAVPMSPFTFNEKKMFEAFQEVKDVFPYELTGDQQESIRDIIGIILSGEPLNGLVQGDVGSGKTIVAFAAMYMAVKNGFQSVLLAPTNVLATQHYNEFKAYAERLDIGLGFITGDTKAAPRRALIKGLKDNTINMVIGTHAAYSKELPYDNLAMVVFDEQHRFGVDQRSSFSDLNPHTITMSATPIPRTLSMAMFGNNTKVLNIKTRPQGRKAIMTSIINNDQIANDFMLREIQKGHQCYVVCPLVEESSAEMMANVTSVAEEEVKLRKYFAGNKDINIAAISGKMKKADVNEIITKYENNEIQILISTTVIEVGVNVPNSTVMVLKNSERFGLAQAHQLRGRVGRGNDQSYCLLQTVIEDEPKSRILAKTNDGFNIAQEDLKLRGAGDYIGTEQTGNNNEVMLMIKEPQLFQSISDTIDDIYEDDDLVEYFDHLLIKKEE